MGNNGTGKFIYLSETIQLVSCYVQLWTQAASFSSLDHPTIYIYFPKPIKDVLATKAKWGRKIKMNDFLKMFQWKFNLLVGNFKFKSGRFKWPNCLFYSIFPTLPISFCFLSTQKMLRTSNFVQVSALILNVQSFNIRFDPVFCSKHRELFMMGIIWSLSHSKRQMSPSLDNWISFFFPFIKCRG